MASIACPITGCTYQTPDGQPTEVAVILLQLHGKEHDTAHSAKVEKVKRPSISLSGTTEEWNYFVSRWAEYKAASAATEHMPFLHDG